VSIDIHDWLAVAQQLVAGESECEWRSGASRAYYAAYHKALGVAETCLPAPARPAVTGYHERLTDRLKADGKKGLALAYELIDLKRVRTRADYFVHEAFSQEDATNFVDKCTRFIPRVDAFLSQSKHIEPSSLTTG
jgi:hypothetical protein